MQVKELVQRYLQDTKMMHLATVSNGKHIFPEEKILELMANPERPHKFYRIKPELFVLFDAVNFPDSPRQEYRPAQNIIVKT
jgi:hypothetical protein